MLEPSIKICRLTRRMQRSVGRGEERAAWKRALGHVVHRKSSGLYCERNVQLEYEGLH